MRTHLTTITIALGLTFLLTIVPGAIWGHYPYFEDYTIDTIQEKDAKGEELTAEEYAVLGMWYTPAPASSVPWQD
jgi:hypothetical protein